MKRMWVVDDMIPLEQLYPGPYPTRLELPMVREMIATHGEHWTEEHVLDLCRAICHGDYEASFFKSPDAMLLAMKEGLRPPHVVIFDWEYIGSNPERNIDALRQVLAGTFAFIQIYTHLAETDIDARVAELRARYPLRLLPARNKADVTTDQLTDHVRTAWKGTIAGDIADSVRQAVTEAVEHCLIDMSSVPRAVLAAVADGRAENLLQLVLSRVRDDLGAAEVELFGEILAGGTGAATSDALRKLMSVWYYSFPTDNRVRRGDVIEIDGGLGLVVTPPCDLYRFPKKAGRQLTWLQIKPFTQASITALREQAGLEFSDIGGSIVAAHGKSGEAIILLPNIPPRANTREDLEDVMVLCHGWQTRVCTPTEAVSGALTYDGITGVIRRCTLADPFLSAVITRITSVMGSPGTPDLPNSEKMRLRAVLTAPTTPQPAAPPPPPAQTNTAQTK